MNLQQRSELFCEPLVIIIQPSSDDNVMMKKYEYDSYWKVLIVYRQMKSQIYLLILFMLFSSCRSVKYVPIESIKTEYKTRDITRYDSIFQKDSIYMLVKSDTVYRTELKYRYKYLTVHKSDTVLKTDSVLTPYSVEKQLTKWQTIKIELGGWAFGMIIIVLIVFVLRLVSR